MYLCIYCNKKYIFSGFRSLIFYVVYFFLLCNPQNKSEINFL